MIFTLRVCQMVEYIQRAQAQLDAKGDKRLSQDRRHEEIVILRDVQATLKERLHRLEIRQQADEWAAERGMEVKIRRAPAMRGRVGASGEGAWNGVIPIEFADGSTARYEVPELIPVVPFSVWKQYH